MNQPNSRIELTREELLGQEFTSNVLNFKISGLDLLPQGYRCISLEADDPALEKLSAAAVAIKAQLNKTFSSDDMIARVEFTKVSKPDGTEDQMLSVKFKNEAIIDGKKSTIVIQDWESVKFVTEQIAIALSNGSNIQSATDGRFADFDKDTRLKAVQPNDLKDSNTMMVREYEPDTDAPDDERAAYEETRNNMDRIVQEHGSAMFILGVNAEEKKGGFLRGAPHKLFTFFALGASSCGSCSGQDSTHQSSQKNANSALDEKFEGRVKAKLTAIPNHRGSFAILENKTAAPT